MEDDRLEAAKHASTGQLLLKAARLLDEVALERVRSVPGAPPVRPAHTRLFPHISLDGVRATDIASRLGVTKQAVAPLVADLVDWGMVEQVPDPSDGRARLVRWTEEGRRGLLHGLGVLGRLESEWAERAGADAVAVTRQSLLTLLAMLGAELRSQ
jgi:DNA-binding MarR family transcriptional regulator